MRKVGATSSGSVIIEMSNAQFEALQLVVAGKPHSSDKASSPDKSEVKVMAVKRKLDHVRNCILKLKPSTLEELMRSVRTIHPFTGGFAEKEIEHLLKILVREGLFTISEGGEVHYCQSDAGEMKFVPACEVDFSVGDRKKKEKAPLVSE